jgi:hypothetical protein
MTVAQSARAALSALAARSCSFPVAPLARDDRAVTPPRAAHRLLDDPHAALGPFTANRMGNAFALGFAFRLTPDCAVCQIGSGDADDRGHLSCSTCLGLLHPSSAVPDVKVCSVSKSNRKLEKLAGIVALVSGEDRSAPCSCLSAFLGGPRHRALFGVGEYTDLGADMSN